MEEYNSMLKENKNSLKDAFYSDCALGECKNNEFEFGNTHRQMIYCMYCVDGCCHYKGHCDRKYEDFSGWDIV